VARERHEARYEEIKEELAAEGTDWKELHRKTIAQLWEELGEKEQKKCSETAKSRNTGEIDEKEKRK
jgi:hypothetical protein